MEWIRASASMPFVSRTVNVGGYTLLDGGMSDAIPLRFMVDKGITRNVVILTQPRDYVKSAANPLTMKLLLGKYPAMVEVMKNRHAMYRYERDYAFTEEREGRALVLCPDEALDISRTEHDPVKLKAVYDLGREVTLRRLEEIRGFIQ